jgi:hypothetical protein
MVIGICIEMVMAKVIVTIVVRVRATRLSFVL